jgi:hypothetical protein
MSELQSDIRALTRWLKRAIVVAVLLSIPVGAMCVALFRSVDATSTLIDKTKTVSDKVNDLAQQIERVKTWDEAKKKAWEARLGQLEAEVRRLGKARK